MAPRRTLLRAPRAGVAAIFATGDDDGATAGLTGAGFNSTNSTGTKVCTASSGDILAGAVSFDGARRRSSQPSRERRSHLKIRLAFNPCRRATAATDAPGDNASATIRCRSSRLHLRRLTLSYVADIWRPPVR